MVVLGVVVVVVVVVNVVLVAYGVVVCNNISGV